jgi:tetracycline 7-halogenase / FADH2 O2-dependent halogenase
VTKRCTVAIVGSGFSGSILARVLAVQGHRVVLLERGTHPRFAIGESTTPLANLSLERLARRYGLADCYHLAAHGRWLARYPEVRRGLKRGFTFYRHHPREPLADRGLDSERLLVAASPSDAIADTHWLRADVDHHFVREAIAAGVDYQDRVELTDADIGARGARLRGRRYGHDVDYKIDFVIDASGPGGFLARHLSIPSGLGRTRTRSALVFSHFSNVRLMTDVMRGLPPGPYPDDWAAMHHVIDGGWMYSLRFDHGVVSAGFALSPRGLAAVTRSRAPDARQLWERLLERYPTIRAAFETATPVMPLAFRSRIQHRLTRAAGARWALMPHTYAFVDPLFSTGIAWSFRAIERLAHCFEAGLPTSKDLKRYAELLAAEADQIDTLVAGAYEAMAHFDLFAAHALIYFATVSFAEVRQRLVESSPWSGFLGVGDPVLGPLPRQSLRRLGRAGFERWVASAIAPRNIAGFADPAAHNLYPVDLDVLVDRHALLGLSREEIVAALPALRGVSAV